MNGREEKIKKKKKKFGEEEKEKNKVSRKGINPRL
jgi:hypothetical protein